MEESAAMGMNRAGMPMPMLDNLSVANGDHFDIFIDKLCERLAFERLGMRLYDALQARFAAAEELPGSLHLEDLRRIRADEARHFDLVTGAMATLDAATARKISSIELALLDSSTLVQAISDPHTTVIQALHALLIAELTDQMGWEMLIVLARENHQVSLAAEFTAALAEEREHLRLVQKWYQESLLGHALPDFDTWNNQAMHH